MTSAILDAGNQSINQSTNSSWILHFNKLRQENLTRLYIFIKWMYFSVYICVVIWVCTCVLKFYTPKIEQDWRKIHNALTLLTLYSFLLTRRGLIALCSLYSTSFVHDSSTSLEDSLIPSFFFWIPRTVLSSFSSSNHVSYANEKIEANKREGL